MINPFLVAHLFPNSNVPEGTLILDGGKGLFFLLGTLQHLRVVRRQTVEQHWRKNLSLQWKSNLLNTSWATPARGKISVITCLGRQDDAAWFIHTWMILHLCWRHCSWARVNHCKDQCAWWNPGGIYQNYVLQFGGWRLGNVETNLVWQLRDSKMRLRSFWGCYSHCSTTSSFTCERPEFNTLFSMLREKNVAITTSRRQTNCEHSFVLQNIAYLEDSNIFWNRTAGRRRLEEHLVTANVMLDKSDAVGIFAWIIRFVERVWPGALACIMEGPCWWGNSCPSRMDFAMRIFRTMWRNCGWHEASSSWQEACGKGDANSTLFFCGVTMGDARMEGRGGKYWFQLDGRWSELARFTFYWRHSEACALACGNG